MHSTEQQPETLDIEQQGFVLQVARQAIEAALKLRKAVQLPSVLDTRLTSPGACFVTLEKLIDKRRSLRGCIGTLEPHQALIEDVMHNARAAALRDPRFPPLDTDELETVSISVSILQSPYALYVSSPVDLYEQLNARRTGLIVEQWRRDHLVHKATFLPSVWQQISKPEQFVRELKRKAGIEADYWSSELRWFAYETQSFSEQDAPMKRARGPLSNSASP